MDQPSARPERRLAAIFAADVEGYSRLMGLDEARTMAMLTARRATASELIAGHHGRVVDTAGDSILAEFGSVLDAVECALEVQRVIAKENDGIEPERQMWLRIGVHLGDVLVRGHELFGDGVNTAARLQALAEPGGICISGAVHEQVRRKLPLAVTDLGAQVVKNIAEPVRSYQIRAAEETAGRAGSASGAPKLPLPDKPSIAVLPFNNMSGDPEQEYFADGISEDLITGLSRIRWLFVIARNSTFVYKGRAVDVKQVSRELGVRYVLEGSVRKSGSRLRITAQLVDAITGGHHWAERFDRELVDIFDLQDEITRNVAAAIEPHLLSAEGIRSLARSPDDLGAWDMVMRALAHFWRTTRADTEAAINILDKAVKQYPDYASAQSLLAFSLVFAVHMGWVDGTEALPKAQRHAERAAELDDRDPWVHLALGYLAMMYRRTDESIAECRRALDLNPSSATARGYLGRVLGWAGRDREAISSLEEAIRLSPYDPQNALFLANIGLCHYLAGRFVQSVEFLTKAFKERPKYLGLQRLLCASLAQAGRVVEARELLADIMREQPSLSIDWIKQNVPYQTPELMERFLDGMRKAGLT